MTAQAPVGFVGGVGVVVPTRNRPVLLRQALESVAAQVGVERVQVVVVDEASDPPVDPASFPPGLAVTLLRNDSPVGPAAARNQGAEALTTPFVAFLDDDDRYLPQKAARCLGVFREHPEVGAVVHRAVFEGSAIGGTGGVIVLDDPVRTWLLSQPPHVITLVVRREVHDRVRFDPTFAAAEDLDYMLRLAQTTSVAVLDRVLAVHGQSNDRVSSIGMAKRLEGRRRFREKHDALFDRQAHAFHLLRRGHLHRRAAERGAAARSFAQSFVAHPSALAAKGLLLSVLPGRAGARLVARRR